MLWSKTSSTGTRESAHESTAANGSCFSSVCCLSIERSCSWEVSCPDTNRLLPAISSSRAALGVSVDWACTLRGNTALRPLAKKPAAVVISPVLSSSLRDHSSLAAFFITSRSLSSAVLDYEVLCTPELGSRAGLTSAEVYQSPIFDG